MRESESERGLIVSLWPRAWREGPWRMVNCGGKDGMNDEELVLGGRIGEISRIGGNPGVNDGEIEIG